MLRIKLCRRRPQHKESGYMLLVLMLAVAVLTITMLGVARNYRRSVQRDREVEMIHRGEQYARAVKRFYKKVGHYPTSIDQLENTNKIRFLRKRYKDPMSPDGEWKIAHATDIKLPGITATAVPNPTGAPGTLGNPAGILSGTLSQSNASDSSSNAVHTNQATDASSGTTGIGSASASGSSTSGESAQGTTGGSNSTTDNSNTGPGGAGNATNQVLGGGDMFGVVSKSKAQGIHSFGDKSKYNEWFFIYVPTQDTGNALITGPYNPKMFIGSANSGLGTKGTGGQSGSNSTTTTPGSATMPTTTTTPATTNP